MTNKLLVATLFATTLLAAACSEGRQDSGAGAAASPTTEKPPLEYMVASIDAGYRVTEDTIQVKRIRYLLKSLSEHTGESQQAIADHTAQATNYAREEYGKDIKNLERLERANEFYKATGSKEKYNYVMAMLNIAEAK